VDGPVLWGFSGGALAVLNGGPKAILTWTNGGASVNGGFSFSSDRNVKSGFEALEPSAVLGKLSALPVSAWSYTNETSSRHIGPMAQDFHDAFGLNGADETHINIGDEAGVALAAIKGLNETKADKETVTRQLEEQAAAIKAKDAQIEQLTRRIEVLESNLERK
jgi:hypothetical protein